MMIARNHDSCQNMGVSQILKIFLINKTTLTAYILAQILIPERQFPV